TFTIEVFPADHYLSYVTPSHGGNSGSTHIQVRGLRFVPGMHVKIRNQLGDIEAESGVADLEETLLGLSLNLTGMSPGVRSIVVRWPSGTEQMLENSFQIVPGVGPKFEARLILPETTRQGRKYVLWAEYENKGDSDMPSPLLALATTSDVSMSFSPEGPFLRNPLLFLAVNFSDPAGILPPGSKNRIPLYFIATDPCQFSFGTVGFFGVLDTEFSSMEDYFLAMSNAATRLTRRGDGIKYKLDDLDPFERDRRNGISVGAISGTVFNEYTQSQAWNTKVQAIPDGEVAQVTGESVTNDLGHFVMERLEPGGFDFHVPGYFMPSAVEVELATDEDVNDVDLYIWPLATPTPDPCDGWWGAPPVGDASAQSVMVLGTHCVDGSFSSESLTSKLKWLKLTGADKGFKVAARLQGCGEINGCELSISGGLSGAVDTPFEGFEISGSGKGKWKVDPEKCEWDFKSGNATLSGQVTKKYPIGMKFLPPGMKFLDIAKLDLAVSASASGSAAWKEGDYFPGLPSDGSVSLGVGFSAIGSVRSYTGSPKGEVSVTGSVNATLGFGNTPSSVVGCATLKASGEIGKIRYNYTLQECEHFVGGSPASYSSDIVPEIEIISYIGLPTRFGSNTVLASVESDLQEDGAPSLAVSPGGVVLCVWTKDRPESNLLGSAVVASEYSGGTWTTPTTIASYDRICTNAAVVYDSSGEAWAVWNSAPTVTQGSSAEEISEALNSSTIYYSHRVAGTWSTPAALGDLEGLDKMPTVAAGDNGLLCAAWVCSASENSSIVASLYDGSQWSQPEVLSSGPASEQPTVVFDGSIPCVVWSEEAALCMARTASSVLMSSEYRSSAWSFPQPVHNEPRETQSFPTMAIDDNGIKYLAWQESGLIHCATGQNGNWLASYTISDSTGSSPKMALCGNKPFIIYETGFGNDADIVYIMGELSGSSFLWSDKETLSPTTAY
ncbi:MAG TPA: sialidase family protein, partial [bacterium]|nr:sialidase family protein [bacterium]